MAAADLRAQGTTTGASEGADGVLDGLAVPDELLAEAATETDVAQRSLDLGLVAGVGEGNPAPLLEVLREHGARPALVVGAAALLVQSVESGIALLGPEIQRTFGISDAGLGAVIFALAAAPMAWGVPIGLWGDRGHRVRVAAWTVAVTGVVIPLMGIAPSAWVLGLLALAAGIGRSSANTVQISYLTDAYPVESRGRILAFHRAADPLGKTVGGLTMGGIAAIAGGTAGWRWSMLVGVVGLGLAVALSRLKEPDKGANEQEHALAAAGLTAIAAGDAPVDEPRLLLGSALQRLLRIRSLYFQLIAMAVLGFAAVGVPLLGALYLERTWGLGPGGRAVVVTIVAAAGFIGVPVGGWLGDRLYRRSPDLPLLLGGGALAAFGVIYAAAIHLPALWMVVAGFFVAELFLAPLATAITLTVSATAPPKLRSLTFALFGIYSLVFGGFAGSVILGAVSDATSPQTALTLVGPVTVIGGLLLAAGSRHVSADIAVTIDALLEEHHERRRLAAGGDVQALQVHGVGFSYGNQQVLFDVSFEVAEGEICALLGTNGAGKSTVLKLVAGLDHPDRGAIRTFGAATTDLEAEQLVGMGVTMLPGGQVTFPSLTVEENLRVGSHAHRREPDLEARIEEVYELFPILRERREQAAGTLSGGEQQMLALGRALVHRPRLLLIDELTLGLAPKVVEELLRVVRLIRDRGTTVVLVEQSVNLALTLAEHAIFLERGAVRYDGPMAGLLERDDLLRPIFLDAEDAASPVARSTHGAAGSPEARSGATPSTHGAARS